MKLEKNLPDYTVLTELNVDGYLDHDEDADEYGEAMVEEQRKKLEELGYDYLDTCYVIHFFDSHYSIDAVTIDEIHEAIMSLAIKDGYDLVMFENGHPGYVAYYNGCANGFEIIGTPDDLKESFTEKATSGDVQLYDLYDLDFNFDCYIEGDDNLRELVEEL